MILRSMLIVTAFATATLFAPASAEEYALDISLLENGEEFAAPQIIVAPGVIYSVDVPPLDRYKLRIGIAPDTGKWTKEAFGRDLGEQADQFAFVITALEVRDRESDTGYKEIFKTNLLVLKTGRNYSAHVPVSEFDLKAVTGTGSVKTLSINISTSAWENSGARGVSVLPARNQLDTPAALPPQVADDYQTPES